MSMTSIKIKSCLSYSSTNFHICAETLAQSITLTVKFDGPTCSTIANKISTFLDEASHTLMMPVNPAN